MDKMQNLADKLVEPLTRRERAILQHLAEEKSNREIAALEVLSLNSVKWYIQQIYGKLGVNRRRAAIERARSLGLLPALEPSSSPKTTVAEVRPSPLPTGTVTFLFTDVEGNVPIWENDPAAMKAALGRHHEILHAAAQHHYGVVFKIMGDEFQIAFDVPADALEAALEAQRTLRDEPWGITGPLSVRMGMHTGPAEIVEGVQDTRDYAVSHTINRVARIRSAAHGGQMLLSSATAELLHGYRPQEIQLRDLGECYLKGMSIPEHVFQVVVPDLPDVYPSLISISHPLHNLPVQLTSFIGREQEIAEVCRLLAEHRLVTLTGSGGTGKTRLALQVATEVLEQYPNGAWLAELAPLADPALVPKSVASALGVPESPGHDIRDTLVSFLCQKHLLLILDNCEHLLEACARLADMLLHACPDLTILASSREILGVEGETPFRVPSMTVPDPHRLPSLDEFTSYEAIRLFVERGQVVAPGFGITDENASTLAQVVNRLDGIPLAIELAAARLRLLSLEQIAARLNDAFRLLTGGSRTVLPRHQTLRALIDWSYNLLSEPERTLLRRLSVFAGSWTLEAAEQVCVDPGKTPGAILPTDILDLLGELVDKSLVIPAQERGSVARFGMLETVRQYTHEKLVDGGEAEAARLRHMQYYYQLTQTLAPKIRSREQIETLDRLELELGNLRLALEWALQTDIESELTLAATLKWLWHIRTHWSEGISWLERGLEAEHVSRGATPPDSQRAIVQAEALSVLGFHLIIQITFGEDPDNALKKRLKACVEESMALFQASGNENTSGYAWAKWALAGELQFETNINHMEQAQVLAQEALCIFRQIGDLHGTAEAMQLLASCVIDPTIQLKLHQEQLAIDQANGDTEGIATAFFQIGTVECQEAEWDQAIQAQEASLACYRSVHNPNMIGFGLFFLGLYSFYNGDLPYSCQCLNEALKVFSELGDQVGMAICWAVQSWLQISEGRFPQAAEAIDRAWRLDQLDTGMFLATRARLARLEGEAGLAQQLAQEILKISRGLPPSLASLELGRQALENADLPKAVSHFCAGFQDMFHSPSLFFWNHYLDGIALLAARQGRSELAVRLFGTRWCRGYYNLLAPPERVTRTTVLAELRSQLGEERFAQLSQEGQSMTFMQMLETVQELLGVSE
jgi:predicted ATPase/class 3 adenylate cyclase